MKKRLALIILFISSSVFSNTLCQRSRPAITEYLKETSSRVAFKNDGGLINGGVCWWHGRLQRSSAYLVRFSPDKNPPSIPELDFILSNLRTFENVVEIPGYADFMTFSRDYEKPLQSMLEAWQKIDGFFNFEWIRGISGKWKLPAGEMIERMDKIYSFQQNTATPLWVMAQMKGITSHSLLIVHMEKSDTGYSLDVIDSNYPLETYKIDYFHGDHFLKTLEGSKFVPYVGFQNDFRKIFSTLARTCGVQNFNQDINIPEGEVELTYNTEQPY